MKNIKIKLFILVSGLFMLSCNDAIDIVQPGELYPETTFETVEDLQLGLNGVYANVPAEGGIYFTSIFTDEAVIGRSNGGQGVAYLQGILNSNSSPSGIWTGNYRTINLANRLIAAAEGVEYEASEEVAYNHILAQAYALRAFCHFQLLTYYATDIKNDNALGVIKLDFIPSINDQLPRSTVGEVFELIEDDLLFVESNIDPSESNVLYVGPNFLNAFKARMYAYRGQYTLAATYADAVISSTPLANATNYPLVYKDLSNSEIVFKLSRNATSAGNANFAQVWSSVNASPTGSPFLEVNRALFNLVDVATDVRRRVLTYTVVDATNAPVEISSDYNSLSLSDYINTDVLPVYKYSNSKGWNLLGDVKVFRASEMHLIKAESLVASDLVGAAQSVFAVRSMRNPAATLPVYNTQQEAWADILKERRVELAFEGHRYIDLKRLGALAGSQVDRDPRDSSEQGYPQTILNGDYRFTLPIPMSEIRVNASIRSQQNPGYND